MKRIVALYRFLRPEAAIRIAGGRELTPDKGRSLFSAGANAVISSNLLTTAGIGILEDREMLRELGFTVELPPKKECG